MSDPKPEFLIRLRPLPNDWQDPETRLKALLKAALRNYRLRCVDARPVVPDSTPHERDKGVLDGQ